MFFVIVEVPPQRLEGLCFIGLDLSQDIHQVQVGSVKHIPHNVFNSAIVGFTPPSLASDVFETLTLCPILKVFFITLPPYKVSQG